LRVSFPIVLSSFDGAVSFRDLDADGAMVQAIAVQLANGALDVLLLVHEHEREVHLEINFFHGPDLLEESFQILRASVRIEIADIKSISHSPL